MDEFVPPYPDRPARSLSALATLRRARRNFLAIWEDRCFEWEVFSTRLLSRTLFVCNSPDTVASAFVEHHDSFERKSPQMRHSLAPLLGDGPCVASTAVCAHHGPSCSRDRRTLDRFASRSANQRADRDGDADC